MKDARELFLKTLMIGDKVRVRMILGDSYFATIVNMDMNYIYTFNKRFNRLTGKIQAKAIYGHPPYEIAHIEPIEPI